jgi:hypothetical protein
MTVSYTPGFQHTDWVDNVDRVRAAGDNGFNVRFHALELEFGSLSAVIKKVGEALDALSQTPAATPEKLTLPPVLATLVDPWSHTFGGAEKPAGATQASGVMAVALPRGVRLREFRVTGEKQSGVLDVSLYRQGLAAGATPELIVGISPSNGAFDQSALAPPGPAADVDNAQYRYYVTAELSAAGGASTVTLTAFQITYIAT